MIEYNHLYNTSLLMTDCNYLGGSGDNISLSLGSKGVFPMINSIAVFIPQNHSQLQGLTEAGSRARLAHML